MSVTYSDRSACITSTRAARMAGIADAITAASSSTTAEPATGSTPGIFTSPTKVCAGCAGQYPDAKPRASPPIAMAAPSAITRSSRCRRSRPYCEPNSEFARAAANRKREYAGNAHYCSMSLAIARTGLENSG
jgi:hypothetical protein